MIEVKPTLEGNEAGFRVLFECATIGVLVIGEQGNIELSNPCAEKLFGYSSAELIGKPLEVLIPENLRHKHVHHRESYFARPKARPMGLGVELYACKKEGIVFPVEISLGHFELEGENMAVAFVTDITERKKIQEELRKMNETLEIRVQEKTKELLESVHREKEMNELKSRFVSMASHEFRTPLSVVLSSSSLIEQYLGPDKDIRVNKHLARIKSSVNNLTSILNDFLSLDKLEQGKVEIEWAIFDMAEFMKDVVEEAIVLHKKDQNINATHTGAQWINSDHKKLRYILVNLLTNAIKYSPEGSPVNLSSKYENNLVTITVEDKGMGIPEEEQKHLFDKFFRAKNTGSIQGTGLGLTIVKRYTELMGGDIQFISKENEGTTFTIQLPQTHENNISH